MKRRALILGLMVLVLIPMVVACSSKKVAPKPAALPAAQTPATPSSAATKPAATPSTPAAPAAPAGTQAAPAGTASGSTPATPATPAPAAPAAPAAVAPAAPAAAPGGTPSAPAPSAPAAPAAPAPATPPAAPAPAPVAPPAPEPAVPATPAAPAPVAPSAPEPATPTVPSGAADSPDSAVPNVVPVTPPPAAPALPASAPAEVPSVPVAVAAPAAESSAAPAPEAAPVDAASAPLPAPAAIGSVTWDGGVAPVSPETAAPAAALPASPLLPPMVPTPPAAAPESPTALPSPVGPSAVDSGPTAVSPERIFAGSSPALATLQSYRYTTMFSFVGEADGEPESGSVEVRGAVAGSDRQQVTWTDLGTGDTFGVLRVGDQAWMLDGEEWNDVPTAIADVMGEAILVFAPSMAWGAFAEEMETSSTYVGTETVNGIAARHYTSANPGWSEQYWDGRVEGASADVWIAEAGYPVRYRFAAKGIDEEGYTGSVLWTMDLSDVNGPITIEAPQARAAAGD